MKTRSYLIATVIMLMPLLALISESGTAAVPEQYVCENPRKSNAVSRLERMEYSYTPAPEKRVTDEYTRKSETVSRRYPISAEERAAIERIAASEGGYCGYRYQALVAAVILNICERDNIRPLEVFERGDLRLTHNVAPDETTRRAVSDVFDFGILPTDEPIIAYYAPQYCVSEWHESLCFVTEECGNRFFKLWD